METVNTGMETASVGTRMGDEMLKAVGREQLVLQQHSDHHHRQLSSSASEG